MTQTAQRDESPATTTQMRVTLLRSLAAFALGVSVLVASGTKAALANFIAIYWLLGSFLTLRWVLANRGRRGTKLAISAVVVGIVASIAVLLLVTNVAPANAGLAVLGAAAILTGGLRLSGAFHDAPDVAHRRRLRPRDVLAVLEIALGAVLILTHGPTRPTGTVVGLWGVAAGTVLLQDAIAMRRAQRS